MKVEESNEVISFYLISTLLNADLHFSHRSAVDLFLVRFKTLLFGYDLTSYHLAPLAFIDARVVTSRINARNLVIEKSKSTHSFFPGNLK